MKTSTIITIVAVALATLGAGLFLLGCGGDQEGHDMAGMHEGHDMGGMEAAPVAAAGEIIQTTCPVMGNPINEDIYVDYEGRRIYFCCTACPAMFKEDPEKYLAILDGTAAAEYVADDDEAEEMEMAGHDHDMHEH